MKIELELSDKPEVHYIANGLKLDPDAVVGKLIRVWSWFDKHTADGNALGVTYSLLDRITGVSGFGEMMCLAGWMEQKDKVLHMPKFDSHTSASAKKRAESNKRVAQHREIKRNADVTQIQLQKALPEKRREELNTSTASPLPDWIPEDAWNSYVEMRKKVRKPMTGKAVDLAVAELEKLREQGSDPRAVLDQSVLNSWQGLFPLKAGHAERKRQVSL